MGLDHEGGIAAVLVQKVDNERDDGGDQKDHAVDRAFTEIKRADNLLIHNSGKCDVLTAHHQRNAVVGEDQGKGGKQHRDQRLSQIRKRDRAEFTNLGKS